MNDMIDPGSEPGNTSSRDPNINSDEARSNGAVTRVTIGGHEPSTSFDSTRAESSALTPRGDGSQGILSTARSFAGRAVTGADVKPSTRVMVGGMETTVAAACTMGLLARNADGSYSETGSAPASNSTTPQDSSENTTEGEPATLPDLPGEAHGIVEAFVAKAGNMDVAAALNDTVSHGAISDGVVAKIAGAMGIEPEQVRAQEATVRAAYETQAREMMGPAAQAIIDYGNQIDRATFEKAGRDHALNGNPRAYDTLIRNFWSTLDTRNPDAILTAKNADQLNPRREPNGTITVERDGQRMAWKTFVRGMKS
jgi:hypothetical protein